MFDQMSPMQEDNDLIIAHFNPEELAFMDQLQGGPDWIDIGEGQKIRQYSKLRDLPNDPQMRAIFEQAAFSDQETDMPMGMPQGMAEGGMPKGIPQEIEEIKSHGRNGDTEVALIPIALADFFNELIGYDPVNKKDNAPEYFSMGDVIGGIGNGLKSIGSSVGNGLAQAAPYLGEGAGYLIGGQYGGQIGSQLGSALGRGVGRVGQGIWNNEGIGKAATQGAYQGASTYFKPQMQQSLGITPAQVPMIGTPRDQAIPGMINELSNLAGPALGAIGGPLGAGIGAGLARFGTGLWNDESPNNAIQNGLKAGAWETGMPVIGNAVGNAFEGNGNAVSKMPGQNGGGIRNLPVQTPPLQIPQGPMQNPMGVNMAHGGMVNFDGLPEYWGLGKIFKSVGNTISSVAKSAAPLLGGVGGFMLGGPMGAGIGAALGSGAQSLASGQNLGDSLKNAALSGGMAYALPSVLGSAGNMMGGQAAASMPSIPASQAGQLMAQNSGSQMIGNAASNSGIMDGLKSILGGNTIPLAAMASMSYMGHRDEQKRLKDWEAKEDARRQKYEKAFGTFDEYKMPKAASVRRRPMPDDLSEYGIRGGQHQFFENEPLFAGGGNVPGIGKGQQDNIPARLSPDEYVFDSDAVQALGDGSSQAGAAILDRVRENLRKHKRQSKKGIPPKARPFEKYMPAKAQKKFVGLGR